MNGINNREEQGVILDAVHGRPLPYPIRTMQDEQAAYLYFLARYGNYFREYVKTASDREIWNAKAELLAVIHSFASPKTTPDIDRAAFVETMDAVFCQPWLEEAKITKGKGGIGVPA